jgi:alkylation response protein AidB-like acyl-CoA dehydrogenase
VDDPLLADRITRAWIDLRVLRYTALRMLTADASSGAPSDAGASISKLLWAGWHQRLGELAMSVLGADSTEVAASGGLDDLQRLFLFSRSDTIYGGSNEIQRDIIARRVLGLPRG